MENDKLIQGYLHSRLTVEEKAKFEALYASDPKFKEEVDMAKNLKAVLFEEDLSTLKHSFDQIEEDRGRKKIRKKWRVWILWCLVILVLSGIFIKLSSGKSKPEVLYARYYTTPQNTYYPVTRGQGDANPLEQAFLHYEKGDFNKASGLFEKLEDYEGTPELQFYHAISLAENRELDKALEILSVIKTSDNKLREEVSWNMGLLLLKNGELERAKEVFEGISNTQNPGRQELMEELGVVN